MTTCSIARFPRVAAAFVALLLGLSAAADPSEIEIRFINGVYQDLGSNIEPIRQGAITIRVSSPEHRLTVHGNRLRLTPAGDGALGAVMEVDFEGKGRLIADVESIGRFTDDVEAPRQTARAAGTVRLEKEDGAYLFTVVDADRFVRLEIKSGVAGQIVGACRALSMVPFVNLPCGGLETALSTVRVPMPERGEQFLVPAERLTPEEKAFFERLVPVGVSSR